MTIETPSDELLTTYRVLAGKRSAAAEILTLTTDIDHAESGALGDPMR